MISFWILIALIFIFGAVFFASLGQDSISRWFIVIVLFLFITLSSWTIYASRHRQETKVEYLPIITLTYPNGQSEQVAVQDNNEYIYLSETGKKIYDEELYKYKKVKYANSSYLIYSWPDYYKGEIAHISTIELKE